MPRVRISVDAEISEELIACFPQLHTRVRTQSTITGDLSDEQELQGVLNLLAAMGVAVTELVTIPD